MDMMPVKPERKAEIEAYAELHGKTAVDALDDLLMAQLKWERQDHEEAVEGVRQGYEDMKAGRVRPASEFLEELRAKHGFPR